MGAVTEFLTNIDNHVVHYAAEKSQAVATIIEPAVITGMSLVLLFQGYRQMTGQVEQPFSAFVDSTVKMAAVVAVALTTGHYNDLIVTTFQDSPAALASALSGTTTAGSGTLTGSTGAALDQVYEDCIAICFMFWDRPGLNISGYITGFAVMLIGAVITVYAAFLVVLSKIMTGLALAVGPLFVASLLFNATKQYFSSFINVLVNYGLVGVLAVGANSLIIKIFKQTAADVANLGTAAKLASLGEMFIAGGIGILVLMQVRTIASSMAGGASMETFGMGRAAAKMTGRTARSVTGGQGRENQRAAKNQIDVQQRKEKLVARTEARKPRGGSITDGTGTDG